MPSLHREAGGIAATMGTRIRAFAPLPHGVSLEDLVRPPYAEGGPLPVDPAVFFKPQLVMLFEGQRSEQGLMRVAADRPSVEWYLGHDLHGPLPERSNLTRTRERFGARRSGAPSKRSPSRARGWGWRGKELFFDSPKVEADADMWTASPPSISWRTTSAGSWRANRPTPEPEAPSAECSVALPVGAVSGSSDYRLHL